MGICGRDSIFSQLRSLSAEQAAKPPVDAHANLLFWIGLLFNNLRLQKHESPAVPCLIGLTEDES